MRLMRTVSHTPMLSYCVGTSGQMIILSDHVLQQFDSSRQRKPGLAEAGGQLFASLADGHIRIEKATGPRKSDKRGRTHFLPDRRAEQKEIATMHAAGLHYVGDWHTHPQPVPAPSATDLRSMRECVSQSRHDLNAFIMIIVGTDPSPRGLNVSLHDGMSDIVLEAESLTESASPPRNWAKTILRKIRGESRS
jgi:integrative and conjugative element protein (TIGR02256 family)